MDFKKPLKISAENLNFKKILVKTGLTLINHRQVIFIVLLIFSALAGIYVWYRSLYETEWTQEEKDNYNLSQAREVDLKTELFREIIEKLDERERRFKAEKQEVIDIFQPY